LLDGATLLTIDGTNAAYGTAGGGSGSAAGVLTLLKTGFPNGAGTWNAVPGMTVCLAGPSGLFTGSTLNAVNGNGIVLRLYEDSTYLYIVTSIPFATLPSWANGQIYFFRLGPVKMQHCYMGCSDLVRQASAATDMGLDYWEYRKFSFGGVNNGSFAYISALYGNLTQVTVTPVQVGSAAGASISLIFATFDSTNNFVQDSPSLTIKIIVGLAGKRVITQGAFSNPQTGDLITINGTTITSTGLPTGKVVGGRVGIESLLINTAGITSGNTTSPVYIVELQFECGIARKVFTSNFDLVAFNSVTGFNDTAFGTTGFLP
jgi:hypothetical protein